MSTTGTVILHMTDLHFGCDGENPNSLNGRQLALDGLARAITSLDPAWRPTIVVVTGDLAWRGKATDYDKFGTWFGELLKAIGVAPDRCFFCPGNHDVDRSIARTIARPRDAAEADEVLGIPVASQYKNAFQSFSEFSERFGVPRYQLGADVSHLVGLRRLDGMSFVAMNSSWFCKDKDDQGNLWLGLPILKELEAHKQIPNNADRPDGGPIIAIFHHPREWFHASEIITYGPRTNPFTYLARRCDLMLTGHTHGEAGRADLIEESAWHLRTGATYVDESYINAFTLVRVDARDCAYVSYEYDSSSVNHEWRQASDGARSLSYHRGRTVSGSVDPGQGVDLRAYREKTQQYAIALAELKSRVIRPHGILPSLIPLGVVPSRRIRNSDNPLKEPDATLRPLSLFEAVRCARATLLLGDLGTGKSTLAAGLVKQTQDANAFALSVLVQAKSLIAALQGPGTGDSEPTIRRFLRGLSDFIGDHVAPSIPKRLDLEATLNEKVEVSILVDGLDEVSTLSASLMLRLLLALTDHWPNVQVLATGRPVELSGVPYENWQIFSPVPLQDQERRALFAEEARADGLSNREALDRGSSLLAKLRQMPEVYSLANTPLMVRLLNSHLASISNGFAITTGDLLFEVVKERLGAWERRDAKKPVGAAFATYCPDAAARMALLGEIALSIYPRQSLSAEEFHHGLQGSMSVANAGTIASEALNYFLQTGVIVQTAEIEFPLRPLLEFLYGYAIALHMDAVTPTDLTYWRPTSYAATTIRRLGLGAEAKAAVSAYVRRLIVERGEVLAAAFIVAELRDEGGVAEEFIKALRVGGRKPLFSRSGAGVVWTQAARAFAGSVKLAGKAGFDWFFEEYLDPRYPFLYVGSMAVADVFKEWVAMSMDTLSAHERQQLALIPPPHIAADSNELHGIVSRIAVLMPDLFDTQVRVWFCAMNLAEEPFAKRAKEIIQAASEGEPDTVRSTLEFCVSTGFANHAARLCIDLFPTSPPLSVIRGLVRLEASEADSDFDAKTLLPSIGTTEWRRLLSWYAFDVDAVLAARAAIKLYRLGETRLTFIGPALLRGMHDGGYVTGTEETLKDLVGREGEWAVRWLGDWISGAAEDVHGAHSAWWRIFLQQLTSLSIDAAPILADSVSGLGCFVLARNPEIRQKFIQLLTGRDGAHFQSALRARLTHPSIAVRHGAAMILLLANPKTEPEALEVIVRAKSARHSGTWHEWERFCLTLRFGASSLAALQRRLGELPEPSAAFALAILNRNGVQLSAEQKEQLLRGRMQYFIEDDQTVVEAASVEVLLRVVRSGASAERLVEQAAAILLQEHVDKLAVPDRARCAIFADVRWPWPMSRERLEQEWSRAKADPVYAAAVESAAHEAVDQGFQEPLLYLLLKCSPEDALSMKGILWALVGQQQGLNIHHWEERGQWMIEFLERHPGYRNATGTAAVGLLDDPRVRGGRFREPQHWLALLADECGAIDRGRIEEILGSYPIEKSATVALMARAGVPPNRFRRGNASLPANFALQPKPAPLTTISDLVDYVQEPAASYPTVAYQIEQCLADGLKIEEAGLEAIARQGNLGALVASALRVVSGQKPSVTWLSKLLLWDIQFVPHEPSLDRLIQMWRCCVEEGHFDPSWKDEYLGALTHLLDGEHAIAARAASDILALRGSLTAEEFRKTLNAFTESQYFGDHSGLVPQLSRWLSSGVELDAESLKAIERGLTLLESAEEPVGNSIRPCPGPLLLLPLIFFIYAKRVDQKSCRVFMRGLRESIAPEPAHRLPGIEPLIAVDPLLTRVPNELLDEVFALAEREDDPTIRVLGRVLRRVVRASTN
ncbi:MAG TPA: metallophosphoesterase [Bryobacteraceae bacterium]